MPEKLIVRVIRALKAGADTSNEIAEMLGESVGVVSATLSDMKADGLVRENGRWKYFHDWKKQKSLCVELSDQAR